MRNPIFLVLNHEYRAGPGSIPPQVAKPDPLDRIQVMRGRVDRSRLVEIGATGIKVAYGQVAVAALRRKGSEQRFPIQDIRLTACY